MKHWIDKQDKDDKKIGKRIDRILIDIKKLIEEDCGNNIVASSGKVGHHG
jgi:hypothetical protein